MLNFSITEVAYKAFTTKQGQTIATANSMDFKDALATAKIENTSAKQTESNYEKYNKKKDDNNIDKKEPVKKNDREDSTTDKVSKPEKTDKNDQAEKVDPSKDTDQAEKTDTTEKTDTSQAEEKVDESSQVVADKEEVEVTEIEVFAMIAQSLQMTPEQLTAVMEELNISLEDMVNHPALLDKLIEEVHSLGDIITNKELMDGIVSLRNMFNHKDIRVKDHSDNSQVLTQNTELVSGAETQVDTSDLSPLRDFKNIKQTNDQNPLAESVNSNAEDSITLKAIADVSKEVAAQAPRQEAKLDQNITQQTTVTTQNTQSSTSTPSNVNLNAPTTFTQNNLSNNAIGASTESNANNNNQGANNNLMNMNVNIEAMASKLRTLPQAANLHNLNNAQQPQRLQTPIATQIMDKIQVVTLTDGTQITVDLDPRDLGRLSLTVTENSGILKADIKVESEKVKEMVLDQLDSLKETLEQKGLTISEFSVDVRDQGFHSQMEQGKSKSQRRIQELLSMHFGDNDEDDSAESLDLGSDEVVLEPTQIRHDQNVNAQV
ncbi:MAG: hypothetical protein ATN31_00520 [Candidatus Epulonipiscioides saccharophilum]|nr:MAG: hypothetical protein ATN31_00520 [Epulopiscium sp. AS2M-Bin001]